MLKGNLSTRPFYNERLVMLALGLVALVAVGVSVFNARELIRLSRERSSFQTKVDANERKTQQLRRDAVALQRTIDRKHLELLFDETHEANALIDQRTFSWTALLSLIERTLPIDVRVVAVSPKIEKDSTLITMIVVSRRDEAIADFVAALEGTPGGGAFYDVLKHADQRNDDGTYNATIEAYYLPPSSGRTAPTVKTSGKGRP